MKQHVQFMSFKMVLFLTGLLFFAAACGGFVVATFGGGFVLAAVVGHVGVGWLW